MLRKTHRMLGAAVGALLALAASSGAVLAQACGNDAAGFDRWLGQFRQQAAGQGISQNAINAGLQGVVYDTTVIRLDRGQKSFKLSFEEFYARRVGQSLLNRGKQKLDQHRALLDRIEQRFGVPREILISIWGLETNYGSDSGGKLSIVQSLATLAYDCRRSDFFRGQLLDALRIIDKGDIAASAMRGGWAGEIGPMQFLPTSYMKHAVDFDGDGRRDLFRSIPDFLASTANFLKNSGWQRGQPWGEGTANYSVIREWNKAEVYVKTISVMGQKLSGGGAERAQGPAAPRQSQR